MWQEHEELLPQAMDGPDQQLGQDDDDTMSPRQVLPSYLVSSSSVMHPTPTHPTLVYLNPHVRAAFPLFVFFCQLKKKMYLKSNYVNIDTSRQICNVMMCEINI